MDESTTTTDADVQEQAPQEEAQPEEQQAEAVQTTDSEPTTTDSQEQEAEAPEEPAAEADNSKDAEDFDYKAWLEKKGIDPSTPEGQEQIAKSWREMEKKMHSTTQQASKLNKQLEDQPATSDPGEQRLVALERKMNIKTFTDDVKLRPEQEAKMVEYLASNPAKGQLVNAGYMTLHEVYQLSGAAKADPDTLKKQGGQEALRTLASKQRTTTSQGAARTQYTEQPAKDPFEEGFDSE